MIGLVISIYLACYYSIPYLYLIFNTADKFSDFYQLEPEIMASVQKSL